MSRDIAIALRAPRRALAQRRRGKGRAPGRGRKRTAAQTRQLRRRVAVAVLALICLGLGWMWFRDCSLVAVENLTIDGLTGPEAPAIRNALKDAAGDMTTLHVRQDALRTAVSTYPIVKSIRVETDFPHGMRIIVQEYDAVAAVLIDGRRVPVAADGTVLRGRPADSKLVTLNIPSVNGGGRLTSRRGLQAVRVMGAAPKALRPYVKGIDFGPDGLRVTLNQGPLLQFGDASRARAKWIAAARVLGDPRSAGASYLDLRIPERPVAGRFDDPGADVTLDGTQPPDAAGDTGSTAAVPGPADGTSTDGAGTSTDSTDWATTTDSTSTNGTDSTTTTQGQAAVEGQ